MDAAELEPAPTKLVANLPYNVATPIVVESLERLPTVGSWCVMVQREVADRFFAEPGTKAYGAVSVLIQLAAERTGTHPVSREVFRPRPNVDSALVAFRRRETMPPIPWGELKAVVEAAFAHRRKRLPNSLELGGTRRSRARPRRRSRRSAGRRRPAPRSSRRRSSSSSLRRFDDGAARAGQAEPRARGRAETGRRQARGRDRAPTNRPRGHGRASSPPRSSRFDGFPDDTLVRRALELAAAHAGAEPRWRATIEKQIPVASGLGGGSSDAAAALRLANDALGGALSVGAPPWHRR